MKQRIALAFLLIFVVITPPTSLMAARLELRPAGANTSTTSVMVGDEIEVELWIDSENEPLSGAAVFLTVDSDYLEIVDEDRAAQTGFQPFAPGAFLANGEIFRNYLLDEEDPAASAPGIQLDYSVVRAADQGSGPIASFRLRALAPAAEMQVHIDESGTRETRFFRPEGDQHSFRFIHPLRLTVQGITISGLPERLVLPRGGTYRFDLDDYVFDPIYELGEITWSISPIGGLHSTHDVEDNALLLQAPSDASPWEQLVLTARNPAGQTTSDTLEIFVNAAPTFSPIGALGLNEDQAYALALDALVSDSDTPFEQLEWTVDAPPEIAIAIDPAARVAHIAPQANWHGQTRAVLIARDPFDFSDSLQIDIEVAAINDPPQFLTAPNLRLTRGRSDDSLLLSELLSDVEDRSEDLRLSWVGNEQVQLEMAEGRLIVSAAGGWTGSEEITLVVEDSGLLTASGPLVVTVVPSLAPTLVAQPQRLSLASGDSYVLGLDELVVDPDDADETLTWEVTGSQQLNVQLSSGRMARISAPSGFVGVETLRFIVSDPTGEQMAFSVDVYSLPASGEPLFAELPDVRVPVDGVDASLDLDLFVFDLDHATSEMDFFLPQRDDIALRVDPQSHVLVIDPRESAVPSVVEIEVRVVDPDGHEAVQTLRLHLLNAEGQSGPFLALSPLPDIELAAGQVYSFPLDSYVVGDVAPSDISWRVESDANVVVDIDPLSRYVTLRAASGWHGEGTIYFVASTTDLPEQRLSARIVAQAPVETAQPPELAALPELNLDAGAFDQSIDLDQFVAHADADEFDWSISGGLHARVLIDPETHRLIVFAGEDWHGEEFFTLVGVRDDGTRLQATLRIAVVLPRSALELTEQTTVGLFAGTTEIRLQLSELIAGEVDPANAQWTAQGLQPVSVNLDVERGALVLTRATPWQGSDIIELRATLPDGSTVTALVIAQVYPADGSAGTESEDFVLVPLPNALQPEFIDLFLIDRMAADAPPQLRLNDGSWSDLALSEGPEGIWQSSHVLTPGQEGSVSILALSIVDGQLFRSSYAFEVGTVRVGRGKIIAHADMRIEIAEGAFADDAVIALLPSRIDHPGPELIPLSPAYTAHSPQPYAGRGSRLRAALPNGSSERAGIYRYADGRWQWMHSTLSGGSLQVELSQLGRYALMEDRTPPRIVARDEYALTIADAGSGLAQIEVLLEEIPLLPSAYSWDGETLALDPTHMPAADNALRVRATDKAGNIGTLAFSARGDALPQAVGLLQNFPNPFNPSTAIPFDIYVAQPVQLTVYNSAGQRVRRLADRLFVPGRHVLEWDARDDSGSPVSSGMYLYRLEVDGQVQMRKMTLLR